MLDGDGTDNGSRSGSEIGRVVLRFGCGSDRNFKIYIYNPKVIILKLLNQKKTTILYSLTLVSIQSNIRTISHWSVPSSVYALTLHYAPNSFCSPLGHPRGYSNRSRWTGEGVVVAYPAVTLSHSCYREISKMFNFM